MRALPESNIRKKEYPLAAALLWHLLGNDARRRIARYLSLEELQRLEKSFGAYRKSDRSGRLATERIVHKGIGSGHRAVPAVATAFLFFFMGVLALLEGVRHPVMPMESRVVLFSPLLLGSLSPLFLYLLPAYRISMLFRPPKDGESWISALFVFLGLLWVVAYIRMEDPLLGLFRPDGLETGILFMGSVTAPLMEELFFRELIVSMDPFPPRLAGHGLQALLFAAAHLPSSGWMFFLYVVAGLFLSALRIRSGGLFLPVMVHSLVNGTMFLIGIA